MAAPSSTFGPTAYDHFLFTDRFVSAALVRIADIIVQPGGNAAQDRTCLQLQQASMIYNLQGQRLSTPQRGVNIVGGTKIIVK